MNGKKVSSDEWEKKTIRQEWREAYELEYHIFLNSWLPRLAI